MDLNTFAKDIYQNNVKKGFWESPNIAEKLMLIVSELSEALEADRNNKYASPQAWKEMECYESASNNNWMTAFEGYIKDTFEDEMADVLIRLLDLTARLDINIEKHVKAKHRYNIMLAFKHGKKY